jgi:hypothetical protein
MPDSPVIIEFRRMLDELDAAFPESIHDGPANEHYYRLRDAALEYIDEHPEVREDARGFGLPVD